MSGIAEVTTPAAQTSLGLLTIFVIGMGMALMAWGAKKEIDLFFFRASGGSVAFGKFMSVAFPVGIVASTLWFVGKGLA